MTHEVMEEFMRLEALRGGWQNQFQFIEASSNFPYQCKVARKPENNIRNRYADVNPYDHSRVRLQNGSNDYINSSLITVKNSNRRYILCQGPLPTTAGHTWQMVWEQNSKAVIMLNKCYGKNDPKCFQYWPTELNKKMAFVDVRFSVTLTKEEKRPNFVIRKLLLQHNSHPEEERIIFQFHYTSWPDFGVPASPNAFLQFMYCVQDYGVLESSVGPAVIHCSAGIGRSGTFVLVELCSQYLKRDEHFDVTDVLMEMRKCRMGLIQTAEQLRFSYVAIMQCIQLNGDSSRSNSPVELNG